MRYSLIIPVFNRPDEVDELLASLCTQTVGDFEVLVVEDGSTRRCADVVALYASRLDVHYYEKANSGPGSSRNYGAERARGDYYVVLDSDCVLPPGYISALDDELHSHPTDAFGGPDRAHPSFTPMQKAINYSMTSFFTTGGIRGGKQKLDKFYPRSFNMGVSAVLWRRLGGFAPMRFGEDIDFSIRIFESGASCRLFPEAWVWHKRRTDLRKFFRQVHNSGMARIHLHLLHPGSLKVVHLLPMCFTLGVVGLIVASVVSWSLYPLSLLLLYALLVGTDSALRNRSIRIGLLSVAASYVQLMGYGMGFLRAWFSHYILHRKMQYAFHDTFYQ